MKPIKNILIVEDNSLIALDTKIRVENLGYNVSGILPRGEEVIEKVDLDPPDLILMDIKLKGKIDGVDAVKQINTKYNIPIVYVTAFADRALLERVKLTGPYGYITKPYRDSELHTAIEIALYKHEMEMNLIESYERFNQVAENALEWIWEVDTNGIYTYSSPIVEKILGYKSKEIVNKKYFYDLFHPDNKDELKKKAFQKFSKAEPFRDFINRNLNKNGKTVWILTSGVPILDKRGDLLGYRGSDADITKRKQAEERLEQKTSELKDINTVLKVLLKKREEDKNTMEDKIFANYKLLIFPLINRLKESIPQKTQKNMVDILDSELKNIISPFSKKLSDQMINLTSTEIEIAGLIKFGKSNKEIAEAQNSAIRTITFHRENIRQKLGLKNKKINLRSYLLTLQ